MSNLHQDRRLLIDSALLCHSDTKNDIFAIESFTTFIRLG